MTRALRRHQAALRRAVFARDHGVCGCRLPDGTICGLDTEALRSAYRVAKAHVFGAWRYEITQAVMRYEPTAQCIAISQRHKGQIKAIEDRLRWLGFEPGRSFWECHHDPSVEEGTDGTVESATTACIPCHRRLSAEHAARRARRPAKRVARRAA